METLIKEIWDSLKSIKAISWNTFKVIVSTESIDRDGEIIRQEWIDLEKYRKNPVVIIDHEYKVENIVWKVTKIWTEWKITYAEGVFSNTNPKAKIVKDLYNEGMLKSVSIWFLRGRDSQGANIKNSEMFELSFVIAGANAEALSQDQKSVYKEAVKELDIKLPFEDKIGAEDIKEGDIVAFRNIMKGEDKEYLYPREKELPYLWKILQKLENGERVITRMDEILVASVANPILTIQHYARSKAGATLMTSNLSLKEMDNIVIEDILTERLVKKWLVKFSNLKNINGSWGWDSIKTFSESMKIIEDKIDILTKSLANDKADEEEVKKAKAKKQALQSVDKAVGDALRNLKLLKTKED